MKKSAAACPISKDKVDERVARVNGLLSLIFVLVGILFPFLWIVIAIDFLVRSINPCSSMVTQISKQIVATRKGKPVLIDAAPKKFAARMGLLMSTLLILLTYVGAYLWVNVVLLVFVSAILMEVLFKYCIGCKIYSMLRRMGLVK